MCRYIVHLHHVFTSHNHLLLAYELLGPSVGRVLVSLLFSYISYQYYFLSIIIFILFYFIQMKLFYISE